MKLTAHYAAKVPGSQEYSSHGWSLTLEAEPPAEIQQDRDRLAEYARRLFAECRARVEDEIAQERREGPQGRPERSNGNGRPQSRSHPNGRQNGRHERSDASSNGSTASPKQVNFLRSLANETGLGYGGLDDLAHDEFGKVLRDLTKREASQLIERLRA